VPRAAVQIVEIRKEGVHLSGDGPAHRAERRFREILTPETGEPVRAAHLRGNVPLHRLPPQERTLKNPQATIVRLKGGGKLREMWGIYEIPERPEKDES